MIDDYKWIQNHRLRRRRRIHRHSHHAYFVHHLPKYFAFAPATNYYAENRDGLPTFTYINKDICLFFYEIQ